MALPMAFLHHLADQGYHPRSDRHSRALAACIVAALVQHCPRIAAEAAAGTLVWRHNHDLTYGHATWNTDLAIGPPSVPLKPQPDEPLGMAAGTPVATRIAVEIKGVMTEHRKAVKNRKRDLESHHAHVHDYDPMAIAGGVVVINAAEVFRSPLRPPGDLTAHHNVDAMVAHCVNEIGNVSMATANNSRGLDGKAAVVISMTNTEPYAAQFVERAPAPPAGHPMHWDGFIQRLCAVYGQRFS